MIDELFIISSKSRDRLKSLLEEKEKALKELHQQKEMIFGSQVSNKHKHYNTGDFDYKNDLRINLDLYNFAGSGSHVIWVGLMIWLKNNQKKS